MSSPKLGLTSLGTQSSPVPAASPANSNRVLRSLGVRSEATGHGVSLPAPTQIGNGDEALYADKSGTHTKGILQSGIRLVEPAAYPTVSNGLESRHPPDFRARPTDGHARHSGR